MRLVLMGPPGAGKGTQAKRLAEEFGLLHLSSGDIFRAERATGSELGKKLAEYMDAGELVPDDIVVDVMAKAMTDDGAEQGLLLDGFPRTVAQAEALDRELEKLSSPLDGVLVITADDDAIVQRITGRRSCPDCGRVYHMQFMPPAEDEQCDDCGTKLIQREDDTESVVRQRLDNYKRQTEPVIRYYRERSRASVVEVDGNPAPDEVTAALTQAVRKLSSQDESKA
ncbi:MAG: adenylate kinase [Phycisphaerae bacterium]